MTIKTLFQIILKVLGLFVIRDVLTLMAPFLGEMIYITRSSSLSDAAGSVLSIAIAITIYLLVAYYLLFKTNSIIDRLRLDQGISEATITFSMHRSTMLSIAMIIFGGLIIIGALPAFFRQVTLYIAQRRATFPQTQSTVPYLVWQLTVIATGLLLINYHRFIINFIERKRKD